MGGGISGSGQGPSIGEIAKVLRGVRKYNWLQREGTKRHKVG